jgi:outer membrane protein TolC
MSVRSFKLAACFLSVLAFDLALRAQAPQQGSPPSSGQAIQLPLSGRNNQSGSVTATETPVPGLTSSVNTLNTSLQVQGNYQGSVPEYAKPLYGALSFREAVARGLSYNLGTVSLTEAIRQAHGQARIVRSALLPNLTAALREDVQQTNLRALGVRFNTPIPGFSFPTIVGPFNYFDLRAALNQTIVDLTALNNYRSASELVRANQAAMRDSRDLVVYAVGGAYFQTVAASARIRSAEAQVATAQAIFNQTRDRRSVGLSAQVDLNRSQVELQTGQQRLTTLQNDFSKLKINLARMIGLPPTDKYEITRDLPNSPPVSFSFDQAFRQALENRADLVSAEAQVRAAERTQSAARFERLPSLALTADYGAIGTNPAQSLEHSQLLGRFAFPFGRVGARKAQSNKQTLLCANGRLNSVI